MLREDVSESRISEQITEALLSDSLCETPFRCLCLLDPENEQSKVRILYFIKSNETILMISTYPNQRSSRLAQFQISTQTFPRTLAQPMAPLQIVNPNRYILFRAWLTFDGRTDFQALLVANQKEENDGIARFYGLRSNFLANLGLTIQEHFLIRDDRHLVSKAPIYFFPPNFLPVFERLTVKTPIDLQQGNESAVCAAWVNAVLDNVREEIWRRGSCPIGDCEYRDPFVLNNTNKLRP